MPSILSRTCTRTNESGSVRHQTVSSSSAQLCLSLHVHDEPTFVVVQAGPVEHFDELIRRTSHQPLLVSVFDAKNERRRHSQLADCFC